MTRYARLALGIVSLAACLAPATARGQVAEQAAVIATVRRLFDGMRTRDSAKIASTFDGSANLVTVTDSSPPTELVITEPQFIARMAHGTGEPFTERIFDPVVKIDGPAAQLWAYFTVHTGKTFTRCGTDAVSLVKIRGEWKITHFVFVRDATGCTHTEPLP
jgi:hypothetical protein